MASPLPAEIEAARQQLLHVLDPQLNNGTPAILLIIAALLFGYLVKRFKDGELGETKDWWVVGGIAFISLILSANIFFLPILFILAWLVFHFVSSRLKDSENFTDDEKSYRNLAFSDSDAEDGIYDSFRNQNRGTGEESEEAGLEEDIDAEVEHSEAAEGAALQATTEADSYMRREEETARALMRSEQALEKLNAVQQDINEKLEQLRQATNPQVNVQINVQGVNTLRAGILEDEEKLKKAQLEELQAALPLREENLKDTLRELDILHKHVALFGSLGKRLKALGALERRHLRNLGGIANTVLTLYTTKQKALEKKILQLQQELARAEAVPKDKRTPASEANIASLRQAISDAQKSLQAVTSSLQTVTLLVSEEQLLLRNLSEQCSQLRAQNNPLKTQAQTLINTCNKLDEEFNNAKRVEQKNITMTKRAIEELRQPNIFPDIPALRFKELENNEEAFTIQRRIAELFAGYAKQLVKLVEIVEQIRAISSSSISTIGNLSKATRDLHFYANAVQVGGAGNEKALALASAASQEGTIEKISKALVTIWSKESADILKRIQAYSTSVEATASEALKYYSGMLEQLRAEKELVRKNKTTFETLYKTSSVNVLLFPPNNRTSGGQQPPRTTTSGGDETSQSRVYSYNPDEELVNS